MRLNSKKAKQLRRIAKHAASAPEEPRYAPPTRERFRTVPDPSLEDPKRTRNAPITDTMTLMEGTARALYRILKKSYRRRTHAPV